MRRKNSGKKLFGFEKYDLINALLECMSTTQKVSESAWVENLIIESTMPSNEQARFLVENGLFQDGGVHKTVSALFEVNAGNVRDNLFPLVQYAAQQELIGRTALTGDEPELHHMISQIESIVSELERLATSNPEDRKYLDWAKYSQEYLQEFQREPAGFSIYNFYSLLLNCWDEFKCFSVTYRLLRDMTLLANRWHETAESRVVLLNIVREVSDAWS